jgi:hypothetical protein
MPDYSEAVTLGVYNWMNANKKDVIGIIEQAVASAIQASTESAINMLTAGVMVKVAHFLNEDRAELNTAIAAAIATNWEARKREKG